MRQHKSSNNAHSGLSAADSARLDTWTVDIAEQLRGPAHQDTDGFRVGDDRALIIHHNGCWFDFAASAGGYGALGLLVHLHQGDRQKALEAAQNWLAQHAGDGRLSHAGGDEEIEYAEATAADDARRAAYVETLWQCAVAIVGTPAEDYLKSRGVWPLPAGADKALRWAPNAREGALVAAITDNADALVAIQFTHITPEGRKSAMPPMRLSIRGPHDWRSRGVFRLGAPAPDLTLTEGVEDALSAIAAGAGCVHASLGVSALGRAELPAAVKTVVVVRDDDPPGSPACVALGRGVARLLGQGRNVLVTPRAGRFATDAKDLNDLLQIDLDLARRQLSEAGGLGAFDKVERDAVFDGISRLTDDEYESCHKAIAKVLNWRAGKLDDDRRNRRAERAKQGNGDDDDATKGAAKAAAQPWPDPVTDYGAVLDAGVAQLKRFLVAPNTYYDTIMLWCGHTHFVHKDLGVEYTARLAFQGPDMRCGKTTALKCASLMSTKPHMAASISASALFRAIDAHQISLFADEADNIFSDKTSELLGIMNSGADKMSAKVMRSTPIEGGEFDTREFNTFAPIGLASIGKLPPPLQDRSIVLGLQRANKGERPDRLRLRTRGPLIDIGRQLMRFAADLKALPDVGLPGDLFNRIEDCWLPLFQVAELAGGDWPERCKAAASADLARLEADDAAGGHNSDLLADIWTVFHQTGKVRMHTTELCAELTALSESRWSSANRGKPVNGYYLRTHLAGFLPVDAEKIEERKWRAGAVQAHGYHERHFEDAFMRYLEKPLPSGASKTNSKKKHSSRRGVNPSVPSVHPSQNAETDDMSDSYAGTDQTGASVPHPSQTARDGSWDGSGTDDLFHPSHEKYQQSPILNGKLDGWTDGTDGLGGSRACVSSPTFSEQPILDAPKAESAPDLPRSASGRCRKPSKEEG